MDSMHVSLFHLGNTYHTYFCCSVHVHFSHTVRCAADINTDILLASFCHVWLWFKIFSLTVTITWTLTLVLQYSLLWHIFRVYICPVSAVFVLLIKIVLTMPTLQKQVGCFNHRVVTLVADGLERQCMVMRGLLWYWRLIAQGNPRGSCPVHLTTTIYTFITLRTSVISSPSYIKTMTVPFCYFEENL